MEGVKKVAVQNKQQKITMYRPDAPPQLFKQFPPSPLDTQLSELFTTTPYAAAQNKSERQPTRPTCRSLKSGAMMGPRHRRKLKQAHAKQEPKTAPHEAPKK